MEKVCYFCALSCGDWAIKVIDWTHTCGLAGKSPPHIWCLTWLHASPKQISKSVCLATHFKDMTRRVFILPTAYSTYKQTNKHGNNNNKFVNNNKMTSSMSLSLPESGWAGGWRRGWPGEEDGAAAGPGQHGAERVHDPQPGIPRVPWPPWSPASGKTPTQLHIVVRLHVSTHRASVLTLGMHSHYTTAKSSSSLQSIISPALQDCQIFLADGSPTSCDLICVLLLFFIGIARSTVAFSKGFYRPTI